MAYQSIEQALRLPLKTSAQLRVLPKPELIRVDTNCPVELSFLASNLLGLHEPEGYEFYSMSYQGRLSPIPADRIRDLMEKTLVETVRTGESDKRLLKYSPVDDIGIALYRGLNERLHVVGYASYIERIGPGQYEHRPDLNLYDPWRPTQPPLAVRHVERFPVLRIRK